MRPFGQMVDVPCSFESGLRGDRYKSGEIMLQPGGCRWWCSCVDASADVVVEVAIEDSGSDLEQVVGARGRPAHLLLFDHPLGDHRVHRRFRGGDGKRNQRFRVLAQRIATQRTADPRVIARDVSC